MLKTMFRPSDVCVGPDGAIYVADWFDARVGGQFLLSMKSPSGEVHYNGGTYTDIVLNKKIMKIIWGLIYLKP